MTDLPKPRATRRRLLGSLAAFAAASTLSPGARAQAWPAGKPIRLVIPSGAGGGSDLFARPMAEYFGKELGTQVIVDNKPGANGLLAAEQVSRQPPDGLTLLISYTAATVGNKLTMLRPPIDPVGDLTPIGLISGGGGNLIVVNPELPVKNLKELVEYAKSRRDLSYGSWGIGSGGHLVMESLKVQTGMQINHVPYKTVAQMPPDIISGVMPVAFIDSATPMPHIRSGRIRAIAAASAVRLPQLPDVPTVTEQGLKLDAFPWYGLFGPKAMPKDLVERLNGLLNRWLVLPESAAFFEQKQNSPAPKPASPAEFERLIQSDLASWKRLVDGAGLKPE